MKMKFRDTKKTPFTKRSYFVGCLGKKTGLKNYVMYLEMDVGSKYNVTIKYVIKSEKGDRFEEVLDEKEKYFLKNNATKFDGCIVWSERDESDSLIIEVSVCNAYNVKKVVSCKIVGYF